MVEDGVSLTTVESASSSSDDFSAERIKSSVRISSTRFISPFASSIREPLLKFFVTMLLLLFNDLESKKNDFGKRFFAGKTKCQNFGIHRENLQ